MAKQYTIILSDAQDKALHTIALDAQDWIENVTFHRANVAIEEIVNSEVQRLLAAGQPITGTKDQIVLAAKIESVAERAARLITEQV